MPINICISQTPPEKPIIGPLGFVANLSPALLGPQENPACSLQPGSPKARDPDSFEEATGEFTLFLVIGD